MLSESAYSSSSFLLDALWSVHKPADMSVHAAPSAAEVFVRYIPVLGRSTLLSIRIVILWSYNARNLTTMLYSMSRTKGPLTFIIDR